MSEVEKTSRSTLEKLLQLLQGILLSFALLHDATMIYFLAFYVRIARRVLKVYEVQ